LKIRSVVWIVPCALLVSCVTLAPRSAKSSAAASVIPNMPMLRWGVESCGAGSLATILRHYGDPTTMQQWDAMLPKTRGGVMTIDLLLAARDRGFDARLLTGTPELVRSKLTAGRPVILMLQVVDSPGRHFDFFHYIVADGVDPVSGLIRVQFGDGRARWVSLARLEKPWNGGGHTMIVVQPQSGDERVAGSLRAAMVLEEAGKLDEAAAKYRRVATEYPDSAVAWTDLGNAEEKRGDAAGAEQAFRKALSVDPTSRDALNNLAWLLYQQQRLAEAEPLARKAAAQAGPDRYVILDTLARILAAHGACGEAVQTFQQAIDSVPPSDTDARESLESALHETRASCR